MATVTKPVALDETFNTTDADPVNIADVLKDGLSAIEEAIGGGSSGGHTIQNASGTALTQRSVLQFGGTLQATDDSTNGKTVVSDEAEEIEWSVWNAMTEAEQNAYSAGKKLNIVNAPAMQAEDVEYDNTSSELSASTAQGAIDEIAGRHLEWVTVATGTANTTYASQLAILNTALVALSDEEQGRTRIIRGATNTYIHTSRYRFVLLAPSSGVFTIYYAETNAQIYEYISFALTDGTFSHADLSDTNATSSLSLQVLRIVD